MPPARRLPESLDRALALVAAVVIVVWPYIDLELEWTWGVWHVNAPIADLAALPFVPLALLALSRRRSWLAIAGFTAMLAAGVFGSLGSPDRAAALHELVRKPLFMGVAYGLGLAHFVAVTRHARWVIRALAGSSVLLAVISLATSLGRIGAGDTLWFHAVDGLTPNHKTLAVALAPALVLLWGTSEVDRRISRGIVALGSVALLASVSRTAWISAAAGATFFVVWRGRRLSELRGLLPGVVLVGVLATTQAPRLSGSLTQVDALHSRHSLDKRSWQLFAGHPIAGAGPGQSVREELPNFPDYRVNGVDAHGVVQKVGAEYGLVGLLGYGTFLLTVASGMRRRDRPGDGVWPAFVALHVNLLLSTETFTSTHWAIFAVLAGLSAHPRSPEDDGST